MFRYRIKLLTLLGFTVYVDASWLVIAVLIAWTLALSVFPPLVPDLAPVSYWTMAVVGTLGLFASIVLHELAHSFVARRFGMPIVGITLFIFGGVAEMRAEPTSAKGEFLMAIAGPIATLALAALFFVGFALTAAASGSPALAGVLWYLASVNATLAAFNLIPAFPLDGGRMLRAALWAWRGDLVKATRIAAGAGSVFGLTLIFLGVLDILRGDFVGGMWLFLIGTFLRSAAEAAEQQILTRRVLAGGTVADFMNRQPVAVAPDLPIRALIDDYIYQYHYRSFPVVREGKLLGRIGTDQLRAVDRSSWGRLAVGDVMERCDSENTIAPDTDVFQAVAAMQRTNRARLLVAERGRLRGVLSLRDMLQIVSLRRELDADIRR